MPQTPSLEFSLDAYDFDLPEGLIAQTPVLPRDASRLMVLDRGRGTWEHRHFTDLPGLLSDDDVLVANNSKVIPARLIGHRLRDEGCPGRSGPEVPGGRVEFFLLRELEPLVWEGLFHASVKHKPGVRFEIGEGTRGRAGGEPSLQGELIRGASESPNGTVVARFNRDPLKSGLGSVPLPPYIRRHITPIPSDRESYQTVYARHPGSSAAPTAGLHFTPGLMETLKSRGIGWEEVTLHVGLGTFRPVKAEDIRDHVMHEEHFSIDPAAGVRLTAARAQGRRLVAVGTTSVRVLESAWDPAAPAFRGGAGSTTLFLHPGGLRPQVAGALVTNFHLPKSSLLMLVCAMAGRELVLEAYREAVREEYRFFSYGDAMLVTG